MEKRNKPPRKEIKEVGIVGFGPMGSAYAQVCAQKGYQVVVSDVSDELLKKGLDLIRSRLTESVRKGEFLERDKEAVLARIKGTTNFRDFSDCDLVIEAAIENMEVKKKIFAELDRVCPKDVVLGTNTSALSVLDMAMVTSRPDRVVGIHSSPLVVPFSEIVKTIVVSNETIEVAKNFVKSIGIKDYAVVKDVPGGIISRLIRPLLNGAIRILEAGLATRDDIDKAFTKGFGWPLGPFRMLDVAGLDHYLRATDVLYEEYKEPQYVAPVLLKKMVTAGWLGMKTGKGFYEYQKGEALLNTSYKREEIKKEDILPGQEIRKVGIVGCGPMGSAYAQVCAQKGYQVVVSDVSDELLKKGLDLIRSRLTESVRKGEFSERDKEAVLARIKGTTDSRDFSDCDLVIEAAIENMEVKKKIFAELDRVCPKDIVLGTNTSALSVLDMAMATKRPDKVVGIHTTPLAAPLIEIVKTIVVSEETIEIAKNFSHSLGKEVYVAQDIPGGILSRLIRPILLGAVGLLETGVATRDDIDKAFTMGFGWPLGPLKILDSAGLDQFLRGTDILYEEYKEPQYVAPVLLKKMVTAGWLGMKTGKGFYEYDKEETLLDVSYQSKKK